MRKLSRREFLKVAGAGSAALAAGGALTTSLLGHADGRTYAFRAVAGVPRAPLPSYASYVLDGSVDLTTGTGVLRKTVFAGAPDAMSPIALPGLSRSLRVTDVRRQGNSLLVEAVADDPAALTPEESPRSVIRIEPSEGVVLAPFVDTEVVLHLVSRSHF